MKAVDEKKDGVAHERRKRMESIKGSVFFVPNSRKVVECGCEGTPT